MLATDAMRLSGGFFDAPALICYLARGPGAAIRRARTRLPGGGENPVALIRVPRERMVGHGIASSLVHEVGHQAAALLSLVESLRPALLAHQQRVGQRARAAWASWQLWISEIVADLWSVARLGIGSTLGLVGVVSLPRWFVFRPSGADPHPIPWIRVQISCALGNALYPDRQWDQLAELWSQLYPQQDRNVGRQILEQSQAAGCTAIVVTVDQQAPFYERTQQNRNLGGNPRRAARGSAEAPPLKGPGLYRVSTGRLWYTWQYLDEIRTIIKVPMLVKGILTADDARLCLEHGVDGIIVSNHGGRSMDYGPSTLEVLPEIVAAVNGRIPVITDSGYRRGTDILKALALGADAVMLGRTTRWALGAFGAPGVQRLLEMLQQELVDAATAAGRATLASIDASIVKTRFP